jgi:hypothetical protein
VQFDVIADCINRDNIAILDEGNWSSDLSFRNDVPDTESMRARRERWKSKRKQDSKGLLAHPPLNLPSVRQATS